MGSLYANPSSNQWSNVRSLHCTTKYRHPTAKLLTENKRKKILNANTTRLNPQAMLEFELQLPQIVYDYALSPAVRAYQKPGCSVTSNECALATVENNANTE